MKREWHDPGFEVVASLAQAAEGEGPVKDGKLKEQCQVAPSQCKD